MNPDTVKSPIIFAKIVFLCAALVAANASLLAAHLLSTGISAETRQQDAFGNYAYGYNIRDGATGSVNAKAEVGKAAAFSAPLAYAAPAIAAPLAYTAAAVAAPAIAAPLAYGSIVGRASVLGLGYGAGLGHGGVYGLRYGAGILGAGFGKALI